MIHKFIVDISSHSGAFTACAGPWKGYKRQKVLYSISSHSTNISQRVCGTLSCNWDMVDALQEHKLGNFKRENIKNNRIFSSYFKELKSNLLSSWTEVEYKIVLAYFNRHLYTITY